MIGKWGPGPQAGRRGQSQVGSPGCQAAESEPVFQPLGNFYAGSTALGMTAPPPQPHGSGDRRGWEAS